jgi:hypothetical protein
LTFHYDAAAALARIKAALLQRGEDQKPEGAPANPANPGLDASKQVGEISRLASLAEAPVDFRSTDPKHPENQKLEGTQAKVANLLILEPVTPGGSKKISRLARLAQVPPEKCTPETPLSQHGENQKSERTPANLANPANIGSDIPNRLAGLAGVPADFHADDHAAEATSSSASSSVLAAIEDQKPEGLPANLAKLANIGSSNGDGVAGAAARSAPPRVIPLRSQPPPQGEWSPEDWRVFHDVRVGIAEFDGGLSHAEEARAFACCVSQWLLLNPTSSSPNRCVECGSAARVNDPLLAVGIVHPDSLSWLHLDCIPAWRAARIAAAVAALAAMNISAATDASQPPVPEPTEAEAITVSDQEVGPTTGENRTCPTGRTRHIWSSAPRQTDRTSVAFR